MPITALTDDAFIAKQYKNSANLGARYRLHQRFSVNKYGWHPWVFDHLDLPPRCRILELGCGPGFLWQENAKRIPAGWDITLSDISSGMLEETWRKLEKLHPFTYKVVDARSIPFQNNTFDAIIANHMLYHIAERADAFKEICRVLTPEGQFYASTNGEAHLRELGVLLPRFDPSMAEWTQMAHSGQPFTLENAEAQLSPWFGKIKLHRFDDALEVTEVEPLLEYILSGWAGSIVNERTDDLRRFLAQEMEAGGGVIHITKAGGMFECFRKESKG